jgi:Ca2+-binding RTX toxin-like protein
VLFGNQGLDIIIGDAARLADRASGGDDLLVGGRDWGYLVGDAHTLTGGAAGGDDTLRGTGPMQGDSFDMRNAAGGNDVLDSRTATQGAESEGDARGLYASTGGRDMIHGSAFDDFLYGEGVYVLRGSRGGNDTIRGHGGDDAIHGEAFILEDDSRGGRDHLLGGDGNDTIYGDAERLVDSAGGGNDVVWGGGGDDVLWGDGGLEDDTTGGRDRFRFRGDFGDDRIMDFDGDDDALVFAGFTADDFTLALPGGTSTLVTIDAEGTVLLEGYSGGLALGDNLFFV